NPVKLLKVLPAETLNAAAADPEYLRHYDTILARFRRDLENEVCWFTANITDTECEPIAYFSLEYGLHRSLPFYAGGLGFLAGDHLKEASDLGTPLVGMGFMYPDGYVRQMINRDGWQEGADEVLDRDAAPIKRVLNEKGEQLVVPVPVTDPPIHVAVWKVMVGRIPLYLMDTDIETNDPGSRRISNHLYISQLEERLLQEIVLGLGGTEVLNALGIKHSVLHMNEGHPAFALLERLRERVEEARMPYEDAVKEVRATSVFTTHTPVPAGHDVFPFEMMDKYFQDFYPRLHLSREEFFNLGRNPADPEAGFNLTAFALRMSNYHNGVSIRHGEVSRKMWHSLWPDKPEDQVPIISITNGVHVPSWISAKKLQLLNRYLEPDWLEEHDDPAVWELVDDIPAREFWEVHCGLKTKLIDRIREYSRLRWVNEHINCCNVVAGGVMLDPTILTLGFARRFATYKRADLIFYDLERLKKILLNSWLPVQIIFAGKAHPADDPGKRILQRIFNFSRDPQLGSRIAFVEDYGEQLAQYLVHGVDVWLNNPLPPQEACGTSGMKASLNGVPQLSILDGWWIEGYNGDNGWAFGSEAGDDRDARDAAAIYDILEQQVVPRFYKTDEDGVPQEWVRLMKNAIKSTAARFSARRMVKEYAQKCYQEALESSIT
ncbi:MAG TPA: alpha-glucan family phosphorylase, partial [Desulfobaccales bacterium]|nr:alpha-glucan family phosphorylase [Desulfobaccales bacterium]